MAFDRVFGQGRVKQLLAAGLERGRIAHAYLLHGPPGVGKDAMALSMAMGFHCTEGVMGGCGACPSCEGMLRLEHPGLHFVLPVPSRPKSMKEETYSEILRERALERVGNPYREVSYSPEMTTLPIIGIEQIRGMKREAALKASGGNARVFWVSHADAMNAPAANSLLKLLEEPPEGTILFLTTSAPARMLKTIVSRCQAVRFDPLSDAEIEAALKEEWGYEEGRARFYARLAGGSLMNALEYSGEDYEDRRDRAIAFLRTGLNGDVGAWAQTVEETAQSADRIEVLKILRILQVWIRDTLLHRMGSPERIMNVDTVDALATFCETWPAFDAERAIRAVEQSVDSLEKNVYLYLLLFELLREFSECIHREQRETDE